ncbi:S9 family peptidase [Zafaria sp. Z1313]|uniref:S9 family peptidase n=1 Tax=unclassified Zafaria TaxID=2828765 RepID=UPI002E773106|nr:S9 family peptidase [Zafaria sp. J156]MEE1621195.1 S9 family peptidase [Zafaria sp. J156]
MTTVSAPSISPDGTRAVLAASRPSFAADAETGQLWAVDLVGDEAPRRLTRGTRDAAPQYSPDGTRIVFLRPDAKGRPQLAVVDARGGEPRILTDRHLGVSGFACSPDGRHVAFASRTPDAGRYGSTDGVGAGAEDPRRITGFKYRGNGIGFTRDKVQSLYLMELPPLNEEPYIEPVGRAKEAPADAGADAGASAGVDGTGEGAAEAADAASHQGSRPARRGLPAYTALTDGERDASGPCFSPDGRHVYFNAALHPGADADLRSMVHRVAVADPGAGTEPVAGEPDGSFAYSTPAFSRDGRHLYLLGEELGPDGRDFVARQAGVFVLPADAAGPGTEPRLLTDLETADYGDVQSGLVPHGDADVLAFARVRGSGELHRLSADGTVEVLVAGEVLVTGAAEAAGTVVVSHATPRSPGELGVLRGGKLEPVTDFAAALRERTRIAPPRELVVEGPDGYPVHGWLHLPEGDGPHPVLLNIHGGPFASYGWSYFDEAQVYAEAGYAVLQCNPRGSAGYGRPHGLAIKEAMGTVDLQDVLAFLDGAIAAEPRLDGARTGVLGGSYGGYLTAWTIAHEHRFAAAVVERGFLDPLSFIGSSDIGWFFSEAYTGSDPAHTLTQSPLAVASQVRTPTLVLHSEEDYRCPLEQAQRYYVELLRHGVETEFLLFPGEDHELSRSGTPWHRRQRFEAILEWFGRYLPVS